ncbi:MAG: hypothetical protein JO212_14290 [Acetobacteraceae bacterium]|nr:hypothetical protein [Acetobacteraceae bacterium]
MVEEIVLSGSGSDSDMIKSAILAAAAAGNDLLVTLTRICPEPSFRTQAEAAYLELRQHPRLRVPKIAVRRAS